MKKGDTEYVRYLAGRKYNAEKQYTEADWVLIGRRSESMPGLMYPNERYDTIFRGEDEEMTTEEEKFAGNCHTYEMYFPFFTGLYNEFRQQTRKKAEEQVNAYKAESINKVLRPLQEMMKHEDYAALLGLIEPEGEEQEGMSYSDAMILLTQYKSALAKFHRNHL